METLKTLTFLVLSGKNLGGHHKLLPVMVDVILILKIKVSNYAILEEFDILHLKN